jgi:hypothetical protein
MSSMETTFMPKIVVFPEVAVLPMMIVPTKSESKTY